ncbi:hypothetical protein GTW69_28420 [Streptomyces sp. SID7760]|nr:hypothetical protein [Streptomyces sp. SID7760]
MGCETISHASTFGSIGAAVLVGMLPGAAAAAEARSSPSLPRPKAVPGAEGGPGGRTGAGKLPVTVSPADAGPAKSVLMQDSPAAGATDIGRIKVSVAEKESRPQGER